MDKLNSLKQHLLDHVPALKRSPDDIAVFADKGKIHYSAERELHFQYSYRAIVIITGLALHADAVFVPLILWCKKNQTDLQHDALEFMADPIDGNSIDLRIEIPLTEAVRVEQVEGGYSTSHPAEPVPEYNAVLPAALGEFIYPESDNEG
ncbi:phage tail protein [Oceanobacter kriegii]|uniref:phage tail protein n=1 Tax=Oceanobacter kriegii TaxID=64972 RepID=UPI00040B4886|nr:phage tail protein [Oceanobacter kriegii]